MLQKAVQQYLSVQLSQRHRLHIGLTFFNVSVQQLLNSRSPAQPAHACEKHRRPLAGLLLWHYKLLEQSLFH